MLAVLTEAGGKRDGKAATTQRLRTVITRKSLGLRMEIFFVSVDSAVNALPLPFIVHDYIKKRETPFYFYS